MAFLNHLIGFGAGTLGYVIPFLFVLTIVVFFHEMGHFLVARFFGVKVEAFSLGFGPELIGRNDRHGTRWKISAIPLGGYVKFLGDENASSAGKTAALEKYDEATRKQLFHLKPVGPRAAVVAAGPIANFLLTIVIFSVLFMTFGRAIIEPRISSISAGSAAEQAGFKENDIIATIDGHEVRSFSDVQRFVALSNGNELNVAVKRNDQILPIPVTPRMQQVGDKGEEHTTWVLGLKTAPLSKDVKFERYGPLQAVALATQETKFIIERTLYFIKDLFTGAAPVKELGGPLRIAQVSGQAADISIMALFSLTAVLSVSIGLLNLFPIPMLDGGHLVFYAIETLIRRPLSEKTQEIGFRIGLALVLMLMVLATWNDVTRLAGF